MRDDEQECIQRDVEGQQERLKSFEPCAEYINAWRDATSMPRRTDGTWCKSDQRIVDRDRARFMERSMLCDDCGGDEVHKFSTVLDKQFCADCYRKSSVVLKYGDKDTRYRTNSKNLAKGSVLRQKDLFSLRLPEFEKWAALRAKTDGQEVEHEWSWGTSDFQPRQRTRVGSAGAKRMATKRVVSTSTLGSSIRSTRAKK